MSTMPRYQSYLVRCWKEREHPPEPSGIWRYSVENPQTGEKRGFASLEALTTFLKDQLIDVKCSSSEIKEK